MEIEAALRQIDCSDREINTFLAVLERGSGVTVVQLSHALNLPRPTIYGHLKELIERGLVRKSLTESGSRFHAESLESILRVFEEKQLRIEQGKALLEQSYSERNTAEYQPKFTLFDTPKAAELIFRDILRSREPDTYWFWPISEMIRIIPEEAFRFFNEERLKRNIFLNVLWPEKKKVDIDRYPFLGAKSPKGSFRKIRLLPGKIDYTMGYGIYGNKVAFISSKREHHGYIIDSRELARTMKSHFDYFWKISKKYTG